MMRIRKAAEKDFHESLKIVYGLKEWFNKNAHKNIPIDFKVNNLVVAVEKNKVVGFLSYFAADGNIMINWLGIKKDCRRKGIGTALLKWIEKEARKLKSKYLRAETLSEKYNYKPYQDTRDFYYKNGFKKIAERKAIRKGWDDQILLEKKL